MNAVVGALLPLIVTLALGFFAGWRHDFTPAQASVLNRMVLLYALPLMLFAGMVTIKRSTLTSDLGLAAAIAAGMLGTYLVTFLIVRFALRRQARCVGAYRACCRRSGHPVRGRRGARLLVRAVRDRGSGCRRSAGAERHRGSRHARAAVRRCGISAAASATAPRVATPVTQQPGAGRRCR